MLPHIGDSVKYKSGIQDQKNVWAAGISSRICHALVRHVTVPSVPGRHGNEDTGILEGCQFECNLKAPDRPLADHRLFFGQIDLIG